MAPEPQNFGAAIMERLRRTNWFAAIAAVGLQILFLMLLSTIGVMSIGRKPEVHKLNVFQTSEEPAPPPSAPQEEVKPVQHETPRTDVVIPPPQVVVPTAPVVQAAATPPAPPAPPAAPSAPATSPTVSTGTGPVSVANLGTNLLSGAPPAYPTASRRKREQGVVDLRLVISETGRVIDVTVHKSSGFAALDQAAIDTVRKWRWSPTLRDGKPVIITGLVRIPFVLKDS